MLPSATLKKLCRARDLMRDCYTEPLTLDDICAEAHFSSYHFLRLFNHAFGETPHRFLTRFRLERAKDLLIVSNRSVTEV